MRFLYEMGRNEVKDYFIFNGRKIYKPEPVGEYWQRLDDENEKTAQRDSDAGGFSDNSERVAGCDPHG